MADLPGMPKIALQSYSMLQKKYDESCKWFQLIDKKNEKKFLLAQNLITKCFSLLKNVITWSLVFFYLNLFPLKLALSFITKSFLKGHEIFDHRFFIEQSLLGP
jgi:hypothetical protein